MSKPRRSRDTETEMNRSNDSPSYFLRASVPLWRFSLCPLHWRQNGDKVIRKTSSIIIEQLSHSLAFPGADDQTGVVFLLYAIDDLPIVVSGGVGVFLTRQREDDAGMLFSGPRGLGRINPVDFPPGPFSAPAT